MKIKKICQKALALTAGVAFCLTSVPMCSTAGETAPAVDSNFAKALQMSLYFYDANKCGYGITDGNLEWRGDCHVEDAKVPLKPMGEDFKGTNLSQEFIDKNKDILDPDGDGNY